jgi:signal transduction histidine kinase
LRNWRVRTRLLAVILIPIVAALLLGGLRIGSAVQDANDYERTRTLAELSERTTDLAHHLENERDLVAQHIAGDRIGDLAPLTAQRATVEQAVAGFNVRANAVDSSYGPLITGKLTAVRHQLGTLDALRNSALTTELPALPAINAYSKIISDLLAVDLEIGGSGNSRQLSELARTLDSFSQAKERTSRQRAILSAVMTAKRFQPDELNSLLFANQQQESALQDFESVAQPAQQEMFEDTVTGTDVDLAEQIRQTAVARQARADLTAGAEEWFTAANWFDSMTNKLDLMRVVESRLVDGLVEESTDLQGEAERSALLVSLLVLLILLLALGATLAVAQSMVGPLHTLRASALDVAERRLPEVVRLLRDTDGSRLHDIGVERTSIDSKDEIGEVARAFDEVHSEAVRLASEQAMLRSSVNAMFVNLSRRSQSLVERQLRLIDDLENGEQDPDQLASLFKLDHLATRMRRNGENLLVLAGEEAGRRWSAPVPLVDVIRAATSEVEQYERVNLRGLPAADVAGRAVNDVVHLISELLENATSFSSPETKVLVTSQLLNGGGAMVEIEDSGIGMTAKELEEANGRLLEPPVVDVSVARRMGLFVVSRLAGRHGIRVQLRKSSSGGITALVMLPEQLVIEHSDTPGQQGQRPPSMFEPESRTTVTQLAPATPQRPGTGQQSPVLPRGGQGAPALPGANGTFPEPPAPPYGSPGAPGRKTGPQTPIPRQAQPARALEAGSDAAANDVRAADTDPAGERRRTDAFTEGTRPGDQRDSDRSGRSDSPPERAFPELWQDDDPLTGPASGFGGTRADERRADGPSEDFAAPGAHSTAQTPAPAPDTGERDRDDAGADHRPSWDRDDRPSWDRDDRPSWDRDDADTGASDTGASDIGDRALQRPQAWDLEADAAGARTRDRAGDGAGDGAGEDRPAWDTSNWDRSAWDRAVEESAAQERAREERARAEQAREDQRAQEEAGRQPASLFEPSRPTSAAERAQSGGYQASGALARLNGEDHLPIFEAVESEWFRRRAGRRLAAAPQPEPLEDLSQPAAEAQPDPPARPGAGTAQQRPAPVAAEAGPDPDAEEEREWSSPGDDAWRAADAISRPTTAGLTPAGLPIRIPKAHFVPGSAGKPTLPTPNRATARSPETVRGRLASFHQGVRQGRDAGRPRGEENPHNTPRTQDEENT